MVKMNEQINVPATRRRGKCCLYRQWSITSIGPAGTLWEERHSLGARKQVRIFHPHEEAEHLGVLTPESLNLHVIENADVPEHLSNPLRWQGMKQEALNIDFDMERPTGWPGVGFKVPGVDEERGGANIEWASMKRGIALLRVIEASQEVF
jgi:hypothetical protein